MTEEHDPMGAIEVFNKTVRHMLAQLAEDTGETKFQVAFQKTGPECINTDWLVEQLVMLRGAFMGMRDEILLLKGITHRLLAALPEDTQADVLTDVQSMVEKSCEARREAFKNAPATSPVKSKIITPRSMG